MKKTISVKAKDKIIPLKMDKDLFARITLISQYRKVDMKTLFEYPLGPLPWSISDSFGLQRKTNKAKILHKLEPNGILIQDYPLNGTTIYDEMAILQKFQPASQFSFRDVSKALFKTFFKYS